MGGWGGFKHCSDFSDVVYLHYNQLLWYSEICDWKHVLRENPARWQLQMQSFQWQSQVKVFQLLAACSSLCARAGAMKWCGTVTQISEMIPSIGDHWWFCFGWLFCFLLFKLRTFQWLNLQHREQCTSRERLEEDEALAWSGTWMDLKLAISWGKCFWN